MQRSWNAIVGNHRGGLLALALAVVAGGVILIMIAATSQETAPKVTPSGTHSAPSPAPSDRSQEATEHKPLPASRPVSISIPSIGVKSEVFPIGKNPDGTLAVPSGPRLNLAAWYENSPTPGQPGPSVIEGHVDSVEGPSVFFRLGDIRPGDTISVRREDGTTVEFTVNAVRDFPKAEFPTKLVYGGDLGTPTLRLITCSDFDPSIGHHTGNEVVFAHLTDVRDRA
jgi:sortase (surface protein transpeptidase)